jgi:hypothetical protein
MTGWSPTNSTRWVDTGWFVTLTGALALSGRVMRQFSSMVQIMAGSPYIFPQRKQGSGDAGSEGYYTYL